MSEAAEFQVSCEDILLMVKGLEARLRVVSDPDERDRIRSLMVRLRPHMCVAGG